MKAKVFCKTVAKGQQAFYVMVNGKRYFLFQQNYRVSNKEFFGKGIGINQINDYSKTRNAGRANFDKVMQTIQEYQKVFGCAPSINATVNRLSYAV